MAKNVMDTGTKLNEVEQEACPDCRSTDISHYHENAHPYYCWDCGIRFDSPRHIEPEAEEASA